jgi:hypothetical protein
MLTKTWAYPALFVLLTVSIMLKAAPLQSLECPELIPSASVEVIDVPGDWLPYVASPLYLHAAAPMYGPPELKGDLTDFKEARTKNEWSYTYALDGAFPEGKWLQCAYGERNQITLSRRLPDEVQECRFTYRKGAKAGQHAIKIKCK